MRSNESVLIFGDGWVVQNRHLPALKKLGFEIKTINKEQNTQITREQIKAKNFAFALIATPPQDRLAVFKQCIEIGINRIFLEKPIAHSIEDAHKIKELATQHKIRLRCCHNFVFSNVGEFILSMNNPEHVVFWQLNRKDRLLPSWINELEFGLGLDEFPHLGYLSRHLFPEKGLNDNALVFFENPSSQINRWAIELSYTSGYAVCDLWRDAVYINAVKKQEAYWQYKEEYSEALQRLKFLFQKVIQRLFLQKSHDFGTLKMWETFITGELSPAQNELTSLKNGVEIIEDYFAFRKNRK